MTHTSRRTIGVLTALLLVAPTAGAQREPQIREQPDDRLAEARTPRPARPTAEQLANVERRIALATALVNRAQPDAMAQGLSNGWRQASLESLLALPLRQLEQVDQRAPTADSIASALAAPIGDPFIGSPYDDLVYRPIAPCRYIDTRNVGGPFVGYRDYDLYVNGAGYGGVASCNVQTLFGVHEEYFGALAMNVAVIGPNAAPGFLAVKPTQAAPTSSLVNWYEVGAQVANQAIVVTDHDLNAAADFTILASATTHVIVDIFGAFVLPQGTALQQTFRTTQYTLGVGGLGNLSSPGCPPTYSLTGGGCNASHAGVLVVASFRVGNQWSCTHQNPTGSPALITIEAICSRIPGY